MTLDPRKFLRVAPLGLAVTGFCSAAVLASLISSIIKPSVEPHLLFRFTEAYGKIGVALLIFYFLLGWAIDSVYRSMPDMRSQIKFSKWQLRLFQFSAVMCLLLAIFNPHLNVQPSGGGWVTATKVSTDPITEAVAREYLWRGIRMWSGIVFWPGLGIAFLAGNLLRAAKAKPEPSR